MQEVISTYMCNGVDRVPSRSAWGPSWLTSGAASPVVVNRPPEEIKTIEPLDDIALDHDDETIAIDIPPACTCGSLMFWWDARDDRHCLLCEPMSRSTRLFKLAEVIRTRLRHFRR